MGWYPRHYQIFEAPLQPTDVKPMRPLYKPTAGRAVFQADAEANESQGAYNRFESVAVRLFEMFSWYYDYAGKTPPQPAAPGQTAPEFKPTIADLLKTAKEKGFTNPDGSPIFTPASGDDPFGVPNTQHPYDNFDRSKVDLPHIQSVLLLGGQQTGYHIPGRDEDDVTGFHVAPDMAVAKFGRPLGQLMDDASEIAPYVFPTHRNFFEEAMTGSFLHDPDYAHSSSLADSFNYAKPSEAGANLGLPFMIYANNGSMWYENPDTGIAPVDLEIPSILFDSSVDFGKILQGDQPVVENNILNMALMMLQSAAVVQTAFIDLVGIDDPTTVRGGYTFEQGISAANIAQVDSWNAGSANAAGMSPFHLNLLTYLSTFSHMFSYAARSLMIGGGSVGDSAHGEIWINKNGQAVSFRQELERALETKMTDWANKINGSGEVQKKIDSLSTQRTAQITRRDTAVNSLTRMQNPQSGLPANVSPTAIVNHLFQNMLGRTPTSAERTQWVDTLASGTITDVINGLRGLGEYASRQASLTAERDNATLRIASIDEIIPFLNNLKDGSLDTAERKAAIDTFVTDHPNNLYLSELQDLKSKLDSGSDTDTLKKLLQKGTALARSFGIESINLQNGVTIDAARFGLMDNNAATPGILEVTTDPNSPLYRMWYSYSGHWQGTHSGYIEGIIDGTRQDLIQGDRWYRWLNVAFANSKKYFAGNIFEMMGKNRETKNYTRSIKSFESAKQQTDKLEEAERQRDAQRAMARRQGNQQALEALGAKLRARAAELASMGAQNAGKRRANANAGSGNKKK